MKVRKIDDFKLDASAVPALFDKMGISFNAISTVNWDEYPYRPEVNFRIAYTDSALLVHYKVKEASVRAKYQHDNEAVWTDSCVEFFSMPGQDDFYYNIECSCIGTVLVGCGKTRDNREHAPLEKTQLVQRWSSLGRKAFEEKVGETEWEMALVIPFEVFFKHHITSLEGKTIKANFYKCGDELQKPHFLSWNPIRIEQPDFHRPDFFGVLEF